jgi:hypothetical protein
VRWRRAAEEEAAVPAVERATQVALLAERVAGMALLERAAQVALPRPEQATRTAL